MSTRTLHTEEADTEFVVSQIVRQVTFNPKDQKNAALGILFNMRCVWSGKAIDLEYNIPDDLTPEDWDDLRRMRSAYNRVADLFSDAFTILDHKRSMLRLEY